MLNSKLLTAILVVVVVIASFWLGTVWNNKIPALEIKQLSISKAGEDPTTGSDDAKIKIIEYSDFQCPYCARAVSTIKQVKEKYGDQVQITFRNLPLSFHQYAQKAAEAGECAHAQGKFWEMHDMMFSHQNALRIDDLKAYAKQIGLDTEKFNSCLDNGEMKAEVEKDFEAGTKAGIQGTPAFIINGEQIVGAQPFDKFKEVIDRKLAET